MGAAEASLVRKQPMVHSAHRGTAAREVGNVEASSGSELGRKELGLVVPIASSARWQLLLLLQFDDHGEKRCELGSREAVKVTERNEKNKGIEGDPTPCGKLLREGKPIVEEGQLFHMFIFNFLFYLTIIVY